MKEKAIGYIIEILIIAVIIFAIHSKPSSGADYIQITVSKDHISKVAYVQEAFKSRDPVPSYMVRTTISYGEEEKVFTDSSFSIEDVPILMNDQAISAEAYINSRYNFVTYDEIKGEGDD